MQEPVHPLTDQTRFIRELIAVYKEHPVLWDKNHPHYRNRAERNEALEVLLHKCQEYYPEADEDFVKLKIDSLRACFRKEWNKVCFSKASAERPDDIHKPSLWYYNLLLYTVGEECPEDDKASQARVLFWNREYTTVLIDLLKKHPSLYLSNTPFCNLAKRNAALKKIVHEMNSITGKLFTPNDVRKKIQLLKGQYRFESKKIKESMKNNPVSPYKPNLWCFEMLGFLKGHVCKNDEQSRGDLKKNLEIKEETDTEYEEIYFEYVNENNSISKDAVNDSDYDDIFDTIGKNIAHKLRDLPDDQAKHAERLINDVMYHAQMENLNENSRLSIEGN